MSTSSKMFNMAQSALYHHALAFSQYWGEAKQSEQGVVQFDSLPNRLQNLQIKPGFNKRWMGGTCAMHIAFSQSMQFPSHGKVVFKAGRFIGKGKHDFCIALASVLDKDTELKKSLLSIDLDSLSINLNEEEVECILTPYGGGMAYLVIPPVRTPIPLPPEQVLPLTQVLDKISGFIQQSARAYCAKE